MQQKSSEFVPLIKALNRAAFENENHNFKVSCQVQNNNRELCKYKIQAFGVARKKKKKI